MGNLDNKKPCKPLNLQGNLVAGARSHLYRTVMRT